MAYVDNVTYDAKTNKWCWETTIGAYSTKYYQWVLEYNPAFYGSGKDAFVAWTFQRK